MPSKPKDNNKLIIGAIIVAVLLFNGGNLDFLPGQSVSEITDVIRLIDSQSAGNQVYVNQPVTMRLDITTSTGDKAFIVQDVAPFIITGLGTNTYETAIVDQLQVQDTTRTYSFIPTSTGAFSFQGKFAVNGGADQVVSGINAIQVVSCSASAEQCNNIDDDCDYAVDEDLSQVCYTGPAGTQGVGICTGGSNICTAGNWGVCAGEVIPTVEICNDGIDQDCNGADAIPRTVADADCNQAVDWQELNDGIQTWLAGTITWSDINGIIFAWLN